MSRGLVLAVLLLSLSGCGWINSFLRGKDNIEPPTPLTPLASQAPVESVWRRQTGADSRDRLVRLMPAVGDQQVYVGGYNGRLLALDPDSGATRWEVRLDEGISGGVGGGENLVLVAGPTGEVVALARDSGQEQWRSDISRAVLSPPQAAFGVVAIHAVDGTVHGLDVSDGSTLWRYTSTQPALTLRGTSTPLLVQNAVIVGFDNGKLAVLDSTTGRAFWEQTVAPARGRSELDRMVDIDSSPVLLGKVLYVGAYQSQVTAIEVESGRPIWSKELSTHTGIDVDEEGVYVTATDGTVWALDRRTGGAMWSQDALRYRSVTGPRVYGSYVVVGDFDGYLHWLSRRDGSLQARVRLSDDAIVAMPVTNGALLYAQSQGGTVGAYRAP